MNKMNYIYAVVEEWAADFETSCDVHIFSTLDRARECFSDIVDRNQTDDEDYVVDKGKDYYSDYPDGNYAENHYTVQIKKLCIDGKY